MLLVTGTDTDISDSADEHVEKGFLFLGPPTVLVAGLAAWWLAGAVLRPVERMRRQTADLGEHDDGTHLAVPATRDEIAALATTMNGLLDRLRGALAHERGFVADAGHELRTPWPPFGPSSNSRRDPDGARTICARRSPRPPGRPNG